MTNSKSWNSTAEGENMSEPTSLNEFKERRKLDEEQRINK